MKFKRFLELLWNLVGKRAITFYLLIALIVASFVDYEGIISHARGAALSRLIPSFEYLKDFAEGSEELDRRKLQEYAFYFEKVTEYLPRADAFGILGYLYFHLGKDRKAVRCFLKAIALEPKAFNFHYNLGLIYFNRRYYQEAAEELEKAAATSIESSLNYITSSKVYFPFLGPPQDLSYRLKEYLKTGYHNTYRLLISTYFLMRNYPQMLHFASVGIEAGWDVDNDFYYFAGLAAFHMQQFKQAAIFFRQFISANPSNSGSGLYYLGLCLGALGEKEAAEKILQKAREMHYSEDDLSKTDVMISLNIF